MDNELITEHDERIRSYFQALERLSKALQTLFSKRKSSLDGESFYTDEELSQRLKISRRSLQDYRNQGRIPYIKLGGKILAGRQDPLPLLGYREDVGGGLSQRISVDKGQKSHNVGVHSFSPFHR